MLRRDGRAQRRAHIHLLLCCGGSASRRYARKHVFCCWRKGAAQRLEPANEAPSAEERVRVASGADDLLPWPAGVKNVRWEARVRGRPVIARLCEDHPPRAARLSTAPDTSSREHDQQSSK